MKLFKITLPLVAFVLAIAASAFTTTSEKVSTDDLWFYKLNTTAGQNDRTNYEPLVDQDDICPGESEVICVIEAPEHLDENGFPDGTPDLTQMRVVSNKPI